MLIGFSIVSLHGQAVLKGIEGQQPSQQIAGFVWDEAHKNYADRIGKLLDAAGIKWMMVDKPLTSVFVDVRYETKAKCLLAQAVLKEKLDLHFSGKRKSDGAPCEVSAAEVIEDCATSGAENIP